MGNNAKKSEQLGVSFSTANSQLRKMIMFRLVQQAGLDTCHQCEKKIEEIANFSIEHKTPWLDSENPKELFFDLDNIAFSHTKCNYSNTSLRTKTASTTGYKGVHDTKRGIRRYRAQISVNQKMQSIGHYLTAEEAALAYDAKTIELYGENAITNKALGLI